MSSQMSHESILYLNVHEVLIYTIYTCVTGTPSTSTYPTASWPVISIGRYQHASCNDDKASYQYYSC